MGLKKVYLTPSLIVDRKPAAPPEPAPEYSVNPDVTRSVKKGKLFLVQGKLKWGTWDERGRSTVSSADPKFGEISYTFALTKITPEMCCFEAAEYEFTMAFPSADWKGLSIPLVLAATDMKDAGSLAKAACFFRLSGDEQNAAQMLARWQSLAPDSDAFKKEERAQCEAKFSWQLQKVQRLLLTAQYAAASSACNELELSDRVRQWLPEAAVAAERLKKELAARAALQQRWQEVFSSRGIQFELTLPQAERLERLFAKSKVPPTDVPQKLLPWLAQDWAEPLCELAPDLPALEAAAALATSTAEFFAQHFAPKAPADSAAKTKALAAAFDTSTLPLNVKLSTLKHAAHYDVCEKLSGWEKVEYRHPQSQKAFHYYVRVPRDYRPDRAWPAMLALHGMSSTAEVMDRILGTRAERDQFILIAPEYIYGRAWGYNFSVEEHQAVLGALWHAQEKLHIDTDQVWLYGCSQGGHASWDIGSAQAGRFAAVAPVIGCSLETVTHPNFLDTALYCIDGSLDGNAPEFNRRSITELARLNAHAIYVEYTDRKHEGFSEEYDDLLNWLFVRRRPAARNAIHLYAKRSGETRRAWLEISGTRFPLPALWPQQGPYVSAEGKLEKNTVSLSVRDVTQVRVHLPAAQIDFSQPVIVSAGSKQLFKNTVKPDKNTVKPDWAYALKDCVDRRDRREVYLGVVTVDIR